MKGGYYEKRFFLLATGVLLSFTMINSSHAFYQPGILRNSSVKVVPPSQVGVSKDFWKMEEGILLYHFEHGTGQPVLVIHGGPGFPPSQLWMGLKEIKHTYRFYYYHQRGCGRSTRPFDRFESPNFYSNMQVLVGVLGMTAHIADIERIRQILGQQKLILIGHSYGGFIATLYALEYPEHVQKMVLISPAGTLTMPPLYGGLDQIKEYLNEMGKIEYENFISRYFDYGTIFQKNENELALLNAEYGRFFVEAMKSKGIALPKEASVIKENGGWMVHAIYLSLGQQYDFREKLREITVPILVIHGTKDLYTIKMSRDYADLLPNGELQVLQDASHFAYEECPIIFAELVSDFLMR